MRAFALIERELVGAVHKKHLVRQRTWLTWGACGVVALFMLFSAAGAIQSGLSLNRWLFVAGLYMAVVATSQMTSGLLVHERQHGTLGLLFLGGMSSLDVFTGKVVGALMLALNALMGLVPALAIPFLLGGVSNELFLATVLTLPVILLFFISVSLLSSVLGGEDAYGYVIWMALTGLVCGLTPALRMGERVFGETVFGHNWLFFSPAYAPYLILHDLPQGSGTDVWVNLAMTLVWSLLLLLLAMWCLRRIWEREVRCENRTPRRAIFQQWIHGTPEWHRRLRENWLCRDPFVWRKLRDRGPVVVGWLVLFGVMLVWTLGLCLWPREWPQVVNFYATAILLLMMLHMVRRHAASRAFAEDRQSGIIELLLTTPATVESMVSGHVQAIRIQFQPLQHTVFGLGVVMAVAGYFTRTWTTNTLITYLVVWIGILWATIRPGRNNLLLPIWIAHNTGRSGWGLWRGLSGVFFWLIYFFWFTPGSLVSIKFPSGTWQETIVVLILGFVAALWAIFDPWSSGRDHPEIKLLRDFRDIAQEPVPERDDPRLKKWNTNERLPSHWD